ncbi:hypothetical protein K501DRAFT_277413 [Backusella circina FSU 941]|nr:hypothetical protein K501DRAFT_277413 [Backusella circina FSU 941]
MINEAKRGHGYSLYLIGGKYEKKEFYSKAMAWYRLAANQNNKEAKNYIGILYALEKVYMFLNNQFLAINHSSVTVKNTTAMPKSTQNLELSALYYLLTLNLQTYLLRWNGTKRLNLLLCKMLELCLVRKYNGNQDVLA